MGGSGKWKQDDQVDGGGGSGKSRKRKLWRSPSGSRSRSHRSASEASDASPSADAFSAAVATVVRALPKDFEVVRRGWILGRVRLSAEDRGVQKMFESHRNQMERTKVDDNQGTLDEVRAKLQLRQEGATKRERAIAYSLSQQWYCSTTEKLVSSILITGGFHKVLACESLLKVSIQKPANETHEL